MPTIDINDTTLYYERSGTGPAVLFVHGMCGDAEVWVDQAQRLSDRYTCVRYDRRGHTRSARGTAPISDALHADDAAALIEALGLAPCLLVGSSGGAAIGAEVALRYGHLLRGAVLSEPPLFCLDRDAGQALMGELGPRLEQALAAGGPTDAVDAFFSLVCPGLWSTIDDARKDRYRANADIGFTDLETPSLDVEPADLRRRRRPHPRHRRQYQPPIVRARRPPADRSTTRRPLRRARLRSRHLRRTARRLRPRRVGLRRRARPALASRSHAERTAP